MGANKQRCVKEVVWGFFGVRRGGGTEGIEALEVAPSDVAVSRAKAIFGMDTSGPFGRGEFWGRRANLGREASEQKVAKARRRGEAGMAVVRGEEGGSVVALDG